jgi:hypothetical protein
MRGIVTTTVLLALIVGALAQPTYPQSPFPDRIWSQLRDGLAKADPNVFSGAESAGQSLASSGREALVTQPAFRGRRVCQPLMRDGKPVDPLSYIVEGAMASPKVTMINEAHDEPWTRAFIAKVATVLRTRGYTAYGAETFTPAMAEKGAPLPLWTDGYYSREPIFGRLVRDLRRQDWRLFAYEARNYDPKWSFQEQAVQREIQQADNLAGQVAREEGKVLVHVGFGHLAETPIQNGMKLMGMIFKERTGIDPFTVDLTARESASGDFIVCDPAGETGQAADIRIGMPKPTFERGRPTWRRAAGDRFAAIPAGLRRPDQLAIYEARPAREHVHTTPVERLLLRPGEDLPLLLPPGRYDLSVWTEKEGWSPEVPLTVR